MNRRDLKLLVKNAQRLWDNKLSYEENDNKRDLFIEGITSKHGLICDSFYILCKALKLPEWKNKHVNRIGKAAKNYMTLPYGHIRTID
jgi:hypothetical protein